jgi:hypothetical protein
MATKAARPAARVTVANASKRTMTGEFVAQPLPQPR